MNTKDKYRTIEYTKYKNEVVENKTDNQIKIINLYETYAHTYLGVNNVFNAYDNYINDINEGLLTSYSYDTFAMYFEKYTGITGASSINMSSAFLNNPSLFSISLRPHGSML